MTSKFVLITGCSRGGIGHALALAFQQRGLTVFATARSLKKMEDLSGLPNVHLISLDVTSPASISAAAQEVENQTGGKLDILVNNAGVQYVMPTLDVDIEKAKEIFETNYWAPLMLVQAFSRMLMKAKGTVVNVSSVGAVAHVPFQGQYNASKAAITTMSETLRLELAPLGVRVVTLMAGNVKSNISANAPPPTSLPDTSPYKPVEKYIAADEEWSELPADKFAKEVVSEVLNGASGKMWKGGNSGIVRWLVPFMPQFVFDKLMVINGRGLAQMPKLT